MLWWPDEGSQYWPCDSEIAVSGYYPRLDWPLKIRGQEIGRCSGLVDIAIDSGPNMTIWAFSKEGFAKVWKIDDGKGVSMQDLLVVKDGTIRERDVDGDVMMEDTCDL